MATDDSRTATVTDPDGNEVVLLARIWEDKVARDHPELADHVDAAIETVAKPDHVEPDALPDRTRFYRRGVGPSRWLMGGYRICRSCSLSLCDTEGEWPTYCYGVRHVRGAPLVSWRVMLVNCLDVFAM